jgi:ubiquinone/menaquinone biosynthesis C-methylase UbiE
VTETPVLASSYTFDPFAQHKFYHDVNQSLVHRAISRLDAAHPAGEPVRVVELASGTGAVTELILDELERLGRPGTVIGVEPSPEAIEIATARLESRGATFVQGEADSLVTAAPNADAIFFCNAIHLVPDKRAVMGMVASALAPHGFFACNSSFYQGAYAPGSERFYHLWTRRALGWLRKNHPGVRTSRSEKATAMRWLTPDEYAQALEVNGLQIVERAEETALMPLRAWQDIGRYWLFIEGALPGVPIPIGADALEHSAAEAMTELDITEVPRIWLQIVAQNTAH